MNIIPKATNRERFYRCVCFGQRAGFVSALKAKKQVDPKFRIFYNNIILIILCISNIHANDLKTVPQQTEVIQPESDKKELPTGKFQMAVSIDNEFTSNIAKDISDLQDKLKKSAKETVNESMQTVKSSIIEIVKEAAGAMPKTEVVVALPAPAPTPDPKFITNDIVLARSIAKKQNKKLLIYFGNTLCPICDDITTALERQFIVKPGNDYVILILNMLIDEDSPTNARVVYANEFLEFQKSKPNLFARNKANHPVMIIEGPNADILYGKKYDVSQHVKKILTEMQDAIDKYRFKI